MQEMPDITDRLLEERSRIYCGEIDILNNNSVKSYMFNRIKEGSTVLDAGCACGDLGKALKKLKKCTVYGLDINPFSIEIARQTHAYEDIFQVDLNKWDYSNHEELFHRFDCIVVADVLEHLTDANFALESLRPFLRHGGVFLISIPNIAHGSIKMELLLDNFMYTETGLLDKTHLRFFTHYSLGDFFTDNNLTVKKVDGTVLPLQLSSFEHWKLLPASTRKLIYKNIYSWIGEYLITAEPGANKDDFTANSSRFQLCKSDLPSVIFYYQSRVRYFLNVFFPFLFNHWR